MSEGQQLSAELEEALELERRASKVRRAVLSDGEFMAGVRQSQQAEQEGDSGRPWAEVKRDLGII